MEDHVNNSHFFGYSFETLKEFNQHILPSYLKYLQIDKPLSFTTVYENGSINPIEDIRSVIHPKKSYEPRIQYTPVAYAQVFGNNFAQDLSILDILFCEGPNAYQIIKSGINS